MTYPVRQELSHTFSTEQNHSVANGTCEGESLVRRDDAMHDDDQDEGLSTAGTHYLISDRDLDTLAEADMAFSRWEQTRRWWLVGCLDDRAALDKANSA